MDNKEKGMRFAPRKNNSNVSCCALGCKSYEKKDLDVRFHRVPIAGKSVDIINKLNIKEIVDRRFVWMKHLKISKNFSRPMVCSLHFSKEDYFLCGT